MAILRIFSFLLVRAMRMRIMTSESPNFEGFPNAKTASHPVYRILDLCCGAGGASKGYVHAGFTAVGIDLVKQPRYPYEFYRGEAIDLGRALLNAGGFHAIHASPPCQRFSEQTKQPWLHLDLIEPIRDFCIESGLPYVIENVMSAPLRNPVQLCGSSFGLNIERHRGFETNFPLYGLPCVHQWQRPRFAAWQGGSWRKSCTLGVHGSGGNKNPHLWPWAMGINWMTHAEIVEAIPPAYTHFIGAQLHAYIWATNG